MANDATICRSVRFYTAQFVPLQCPAKNDSLLALKVGFGPLFCFGGLRATAGQAGCFSQSVRDSEQIAETVRSIALPIIRALALDVVGVVCSGQGGRTVIRVYIDKPGGVTIADCEEVHVSLGHALDVEDPIPHAYTLEVSSPGLDRPLRQRADYEQSLGKLLRIKVRESGKGKPVLVGRLSSVDDAGVTLTVVSGKQSLPLCMLWSDIIETKLEVEF